MFVWLHNTLDKAETELSIYSTLIFSVVFSVIFVFLATKTIDITSGLIIVVIAGLIFILMTSTVGDNIEGSLPTTTYPNPPHLGLDGISVTNRFTG